jgi:5-methyltetrahydropteroyltriglutamate--homocysteine methyltransferase
VLDDFRLVKNMTDRRVMPSVCGPFSLAKFCIDKSYEGSRSLYEDCARLVRGELQTLAQAGADWVQLDEPYLACAPDEIALAVDTISAAVRRCGIKTLIYTYFGSLGSVADRLWDIPCDAIGADCATVPANIDVLLRGPNAFGRAFGLYDARSTRMERSEAISKTLEKITKAGAVDWPKCWITPSAALEFLPYKNAVAKMRRMAEDVRQFNGVTVDQTEGVSS